MKIPIYLIDRADGDSIPLPSSSVKIKVNSKIQKLKTATVATTTMTNELDSMTAALRQEVLVCFPSEGSTVQEVLGYYSVQPASEWDFLHSLLDPIGVTCEVLVQDNGLEDHISIVRFIGLRRTRFSCKYTDMGDLYGNLEGEEADIDISEDDIDRIVVSEIDSLVNVIRKNATNFSTPLALDNPFISKLINTDNPLARMDILAALAFDNDEELKLDYIQELDQLYRWTLVAQAMNSFSRSRIKANRTTNPGVGAKRRANPRRRRAKANQSEGDWRNEDLGMRERLRLSPIPEGAKREVSAVISKVEKLPSSSNESAVLQDWLTWVFSMPWGETTTHDFDLKDLRLSMDETHYGLTDVKDILIEHMCIERIRGGAMGSVLCFVGPPGTGKTSLVKSMAKISGRSLQTIALGGMTDEAGIRGHRRTYIGSMPGRFIKALRDAESMTPLILLDEVDKLGKSERGDPAAALLEVLDPAQHTDFIDRYMGMPVDLSKAMFICTANSKKTIPAPLRDRMEFIEFREYTREEREQILSKYLLKKCIEEFKVGDMDITFPEETLDKLADIKQIRALEHRVKALLRHHATAIAVYDQGPQIVTLDDKNKIPSEKQLGFKF